MLMLSAWQTAELFLKAHRQRTYYSLKIARAENSPGDTRMTNASALTKNIKNCIVIFP
jgi:hypothetical protein